MTSRTCSRRADAAAVSVGTGLFISKSSILRSGGDGRKEGGSLASVIGVTWDVALGTVEGELTGVLWLSLATTFARFLSGVVWRSRDGLRWWEGVIVRPAAPGESCLETNILASEAFILSQPVQVRRRNMLERSTGPRNRTPVWPKGSFGPLSHRR